jgi:hypothetical protein
MKTWVCRNFVRSFSIIIIILSAGSAYAEVYTAEELLQLHESLWNSVVRMDLSFSKEMTLTEFSSSSKTMSAPVSRWTVEPQRERLICNDVVFGSKDPGSNDLFSVKKDYFRSDDTLYVLSGDDIGAPVAPSSFLEAKELNLSAEITSFSNREYNGYYSIRPGAGWLLTQRRDMIDPERKPLLDILREGSSTSPTKSQRGNDTLWSFQIQPSESSEWKDWSIEIVVNVDKGFHIESSSSIPSPKLTSESPKLFSQTKVDSYIKTDVMWFPEKVVQEVYTSNEDSPSPLIRTVYTVENIAINTPLDESLFDFRIPEYTLVRYMPPQTKNGELFVKESIWGADNKPAVTFSEPDEYAFYVAKLYQEQENQRQKELMTSGPIPWFRVIMTCSGVVLIILAFLLKRRRGAAA